MSPRQNLNGLQLDHTDVFNLNGHWVITVLDLTDYSCNDNFNFDLQSKIDPVDLIFHSVSASILCQCYNTSSKKEKHFFFV